METPRQKIAHQEAAARRKRRYRAEAISMLGGRCVRCRVVHPLCFDHINDDGYLDGNSERSVQNVRKGDKTRYQLLCANCNLLKAIDREEYDRPPTYGPLV